MTRIELLNDLLDMKKNLEKIMKELSEYKWDSDELVFLNKKHILNVLVLYINGKKNEADVEAWANAIECRDDIGIEEKDEKVIKSIIYELANPYLTYELSKERAHLLISELE